MDLYVTTARELTENKSTQGVQTFSKADTNKQMGKSRFIYPDGDPNHSQNLMGSKLDQDPSSDLYECQPVVVV